MEAARLFSAGHSRAEFAGRCGVSWRSAYEWHRVWSKERAEALKAKKKPGPAAKFSEEDLTLLEAELRHGPVAHGYEKNL